MKLFQCEHCEQALFFEHSACSRCQKALGYVAELDRLAVLPDALGEPGHPFRVAGAGTGCVPGTSGVEVIATDALAFKDFESLAEAWHAVSVTLNGLSRSMGLEDACPFVLSAPVHAKLRFIHQVIVDRPAANSTRRAGPPPSRRRLAVPAPCHALSVCSRARKPQLLLQACQSRWLRAQS